MCTNTGVCRILGVGETAGGEPSWSRAWRRRGRGQARVEGAASPTSRADLAPVGSTGPGEL